MEVENITQMKVLVYFEMEKTINEKDIHLKLEELGIGVLTVDLEVVETI